MKIIKNVLLENNQSNKPQKSVFPIEVTCYNCGSVFEVNESDVEVGELGLYKLKKSTCPCCYCDLDEYLDAGIDLKVDNLNFPQHYYKFKSKEELGKRDKELINQKVKELLRALKTSHKDFYNAVYSTGGLFINVTRYDDDEEFVVQVSNGYYETDIPFTEEDKKRFCE